MDIRHLEDGDYGPIVAVINDWWGGRQMAEQLPRIFFVHFRETSFAIAEKRTIVGFLAGFVSQTYPEQAYIHFVGIHPDRRAHGLGRRLYSTFFDTVRQLGCTTVRCVTSAVNKGSIAFHTHMGFEIYSVTGEHQGAPCTINYERNGEHRVRFVRSLFSITSRRSRFRSGTITGKRIGWCAP